MKKLGLALCLWSAAGCTWAATQLNLTPASVIGSSGSFNASFGANNILDQQSGGVTDVSGSTYWLNPSDTGAANVFITIDLGAAYVISDLVLFNTHNDTWFDRGTGAFTVTAGNSITDLGGGNFVLSGGVVSLVSGTLAASSTTVPVGQTFAVANPASYRYLSFNPLGASALNSPSGPTAYGLNEMRVFATPVPEPSALMLMSMGAVIVLAIARRRSVALP